MIDPETKKAVQQRLDELEPELALARTSDNTAKIKRIEEEIDQIGDYLAGSLGIGGRVRKFGSPTQKARVNVRRSIKRALEQITARHPALGAHLQAIKTGEYCVYSPAPTDSVTLTF
jgi:non-specific serine/threonine protein kinase